MKRFWSVRFMAALLFLAGGFSVVQAQTTLYWDVNGTDPGATNPPGIADGTWDGSESNWNTDPIGGAGGTISAWTNPLDNAVFSAGTDVGTDPENAGAFLTISGTQTAASVVIEEGYVAFRGGTADTGAGTVTVNAGATLDIDSTLRLNLDAGKVVLNGGTIMQTNPGQAGTFIGAGSTGLKGLEVNGIGYIGYDDGDGVADSKVSIFSGVITGMGGTVETGGAGTLVKIGPDQIGIGATDQGGQHSQSLFTFAKLVVQEGAYRLRNQTFDSTVKETAFGAVPLAELPDAITLDGGGIGSNTTVTLHANRGVTIGPNGGYLDHGATAGLNIPGPLSGSGTLMIGSPTSTATNNVTFTLSHANNVSTFSGNVVAIRGVLQLDSSLTTPNFSSADPAAPGGPVPGASTVSVAAGQTFTFGSDNADTTFDGNIQGAGTWRKVGTGTTTFTGTVEGNTPSGDTVIEAGTLSITNPYLADAADVLLSTGATFDLDFSDTDIIDSLFIDGVSQAVGLWGAEGNAGADFTSPLIAGAGLLSVTTLDGGPVGLLGDYNDDGTVDAADYTVWRDNLGGDGGLLANRDPDNAGVISEADYTSWKANFGNTSSGSASGLGAGAVPEPSTLLVALMGMAAAVLASRRR